MKKVLILLVVAAAIVGFSIWGVTAYNRYKEEANKVDLVVAATKGGNVSVDIDGDVTLVEAQNSKSFRVKKDTAVTVTSTAQDKYKFNKWTADTWIISPESAVKTNYSFYCTKNVKITGNFVRSEVTVTVKDGEFTDSFEFDVFTNLLATLNDKYKAEDHYYYAYKTTSGDEITPETVVVNDITLNRTKKPIEYSVKFMDGERQLGTTQYFNVENKQTVTISVPDPTMPGYNTSWPVPAFDVKTCEYKNHVINLIKTPIEYTVTFKYNSVTYGSFTYNIENRTDPATVQIPDAPSTDEGYEIKWNNFDITNKLESFEVGATKTPIEYVVRFMDGETEIAKGTYNIENRATKQFNVPVPETKGYTSVWEDFDITNKLEDIDVKLIKTITTYTITFVGAEGVSPINYTIENYKSVKMPDLPEKTAYYGCWDKTLEQLNLADLGNKEVNAIYIARMTLSLKYFNDSPIIPLAPEIYVKEVDGVKNAYHVVGGELSLISSLSDYCASIYDFDGNNPYMIEVGGVQEEATGDVFTLEEFVSKLSAKMSSSTPHIIKIYYW